jgi:hypothetical protein
MDNNGAMMMAFAQQQPGRYVLRCGLVVFQNQSSHPHEGTCFGGLILLFELQASLGTARQKETSINKRLLSSTAFAKQPTTQAAERIPVLLNATCYYRRQAGGS